MRSSAITKSHITVAMSDDLKESGAHFKSFTTSADFGFEVRTSSFSSKFRYGISIQQSEALHPSAAAAAAAAE